ncbi:hypothetical protein TorRG33x02_110130 [Trema orientale]|uniref:Uncharacterized protein n=1 Tax=Trema orientale TaxID=63057 RepID=A0A2P5F5N8_TREOI|nr:hypothetical protein TorRG33x02_110130 [Trema orientale]
MGWFFLLGIVWYCSGPKLEVCTLSLGVGGCTCKIQFLGFIYFCSF